jgi:hypothetical protein
MTIRFEHQPSGAAVGMAAYAAGRNKARQRRQKDVMAMLEEQRRRGNIYRTALGGGRGGQRLAQQQGEWVDPSENPFLMAEERVNIEAQRRANDRALRLGKPVPHPEVEMQFTAAPTKEEIEQQKFERDVRYEQRLHERGRQEKAEDLAAKQTFEMTKSRFEDLQEQFEAIGAEGQEAWADPERMKEYYRVKHGLMMGKKDQAGARHLTPLEYYGKGIEEMGGFLEGHKATHLKPWEDRPGNLRTTEEGIRQRRTREGEWETVGLADEGIVTREQVDRGESKNWRPTPFGGYQRRVLGRGGMVEWEDVELPETPSYIERVGQASKERKTIAPEVIKQLKLPENEQEWTEENRKAFGKEMDRLIPMPAYPGGAASGTSVPGMAIPGISEASSIAAGTAGLPKVVIGEDSRPVVPGNATQPAGIQQPAPAGATAKPQNRAEFDALPPGTSYELPDGRRGVKQ